MRTVDRAMDVLEAVAAAEEPITAKALARAVGCGLSTVYNLIGALAARGYLARTSAGYVLGHQVSWLNQAFWRQMSVTDDLHGLLGQLQRVAGATACYSTYRDDEIVIADMTAPRDRDAEWGISLGSDPFAHATAHGKVLLSSWSASARRRYLAANGMHQLTPNTITSPRELESQLRLIRRTGLATEVEEAAPGMACLATPVHDDSGGVVAAVSIAVTTEEFHRRQRQLVAAVRRGAHEAAKILRDHRSRLRSAPGSPSASPAGAPGDRACP
ncbi:transcriptional regulator, IclR family [Streptoalloteichus tenebrarius]|uniref:Transcriptional regulator, IclR family n=1 Tax=Streptoalloteichus tenebrarius (strain ATCC 17920 / DSM 40477 / JCM 4838 / CBS 697.72 / NBRC 16177 / NCIMB 11028 / NRRL B-12390 / A12253. 1 / ISP 5477) TaxID=1933 RepID=A0ABT1I177_STRSD|nr:IclR family transcriptional regulator [Streptoalloteichus tenebrarius]MCP2261506.1 transcriptional regulator, IclR family [Streptoalloteichus tenebrarius]